MKRKTGMLVLGLCVFSTMAFAAEPVHDYFTTSDGVRIHYVTLGGSGSPVVLIHGHTGSAETPYSVYVPSKYGPAKKSSPNR
jgi:hypothetical protein